MNHNFNTKGQVIKGAKTARGFFRADPRAYDHLTLCFSNRFKFQEAINEYE